MGPVIEAFGTNLRSYRLEAGSDIRGGTSRLDSGEWEDAGIVLTTYETMRDYHMSFARIPFDAIVYDEIQKLKNPASQMRSEEHTSELQSLMRLSYAVFCLQTNKKHINSR